MLKNTQTTFKNAPKCKKGDIINNKFFENNEDLNI